MEDIEALCARQVAYIRKHNERIRGAAATADNRAQWNALLADHSPKTLCRDARISIPLEPHQPWPAAEPGTDDKHARLVKIHGPRVAPGSDVIKYERANGSGTWVQCDPADTAELVAQFRKRGLTVWEGYDVRDELCHYRAK